MHMLIRIKDLTIPIVIVKVRKHGNKIDIDQECICKKCNAIGCKSADATNCLADIGVMMLTMKDVQSYLFNGVMNIYFKSRGTQITYQVDYKISKRSLTTDAYCLRMEAVENN